VDKSTTGRNNGRGKGGRCCLWQTTRCDPIYSTRAQAPEAVRCFYSTNCYTLPFCPTEEQTDRADKADDQATQEREEDTAAAAVAADVDDDEDADDDDVDYDEKSRRSSRDGSLLSASQDSGIKSVVFTTPFSVYTTILLSTHEYITSS